MFGELRPRLEKRETPSRVGARPQTWRRGSHWAGRCSFERAAASAAP